MRYGRKDANHNAIAEAFERLGCSFVDLSGTPCGFDGAVGYGGMTILVEIKDGDKPPSARKLTTNEKKVHDRWTGGKRLVTNMDDVAATVNTLRRWHQAVVASALKGV